MKIKRVLAGLLGAALAITVAVPTARVAAAETRGAVFQVDYQQPWTGYGFNFWLPAMDAFPEGDLSISADIYVPKAALPDAVHSEVEAEDAPSQFDLRTRVGVSFWDENEQKEVLPYSLDREGGNFLLERVQGEANPVCLVTGEEGPEKVSYASAEEKGDYYIVHFNKAPISSEIFYWSDEANEDVPYTDEIPSREGIIAKPYIALQVGSWSYPTTGSIAVNNVKLFSGDTLLGEKDFGIPENPEDDKIGNWWCDTNGKDEEFAAASFDDEFVLKAASDSVKVKKGKSKKIALTTMTPDSVPTVSVDKAKVAQASIKDGQLVIKGKKKGKAVVTISLNGVSKTIAVKVK